MFSRNESFSDFLRFYPVVSTITAINIIIWLLMYIPNPLGIYIYQVGVGSNIHIYFGEYWRLITPIFLHSPAGISHILFNSFSLILFGPALEQMLGRFKFSFAYLFTGIMGNVFTFLIGTSAPHLGASGAIYGLLGLFVYMSFFRNDLIDPISKQIIVVITGIGVLMTFIQPNINVAAHIFGLIAGFALGPIILRNVKPYSPWRNRRRRVVRDDGLGYDPNRWNKRRFRVSPNVSAIIWWIILILAILGLLGGLIRF